MNTTNQPTYRIVKKIVHKGGHHGGAWKVAYADFVTAMMALFIVLWIVGQSDQVKQNIARYFQSPGVFKDGGASILLGDRQQQIDNITQPMDIIQSKAKQQFAMIQKMKEEQTLREAGQRLRQQISDIPKLQDLAEQIQIKMTSDGLRIELLEKTNSELFELGNATPKSNTVALLKVIAGELGNLPNSVSLEGHTDSRPFVSRNGYTNWELSADRANSARRIMESGGLHPEQVEAVRGYADRQPLIAADPTDWRNRRVSVLVRYASTAFPAAMHIEKDANIPGSPSTANSDATAPAKTETPAAKSDTPPAAKPEAPPATVPKP